MAQAKTNPIRKYRALGQPKRSERMITYSFAVEGEPCPWTSWPKRGPMPPAFARMQVWQEHIRAAFWNKYRDKPRLSGLITLDIEFYRGLPASAPKRLEALERWMIRHIKTKPDLTNYLKAAEDALQGVVFVDDSQVVKGSELKGYSRPGQPHYPGGYTVFTVTEMEAGDEIVRVLQGGPTQ